MKMLRFACVVFMATLLSSWTAASAGEKVVIKMATIAPKGSNFMNTYEEIVRQIKARTKG